MGAEHAKVGSLIQRRAEQGTEKLPGKQEKLSNFEIVLLVSDKNEIFKNYKDIPFGDVLIMLHYLQVRNIKRAEEELAREQHRYLMEMFKLDVIVQSVTGKDPKFRERVEKASKTRSPGNPRGEWTKEKEAKMERQLMKAGLLKTPKKTK